MNSKSIRFVAAWILPVCAIAISCNSYAQASGQSAEEHPIVDAIHISGVKKFSEADLLKVISLKAGDKLSRASLQKAGDEIAAQYKKQGGDASDYPNITHPADGHVVVELIVDESGKGGFHWPTGGGGAPGGNPPQGGAPPSGAPPTK